LLLASVFLSDFILSLYAEKMRPVFSLVIFKTI
jgi:hypothetical protein